MDNNAPTYTRSQAMDVLGITTPSTFHYLRHKYPQAFVVIKEGKGRSRFTLYDKAAIDKFIDWRNQYKKEKP
jgi:hypothetical protein